MRKYYIPSNEDRSIKSRLSVDIVCSEDCVLEDDDRIGNLTIVRGSVLASFYTYDSGDSTTILIERGLEIPNRSLLNLEGLLEVPYFDYRDKNNSSENSESFKPGDIVVNKFAGKLLRECLTDFNPVKPLTSEVDKNFVKLKIKEVTGEGDLKFFKPEGYDVSAHFKCIEFSPKGFTLVNRQNKLLKKFF